LSMHVESFQLVTESTCVNNRIIIIILLVSIALSAREPRAAHHRHHHRSKLDKAPLTGAQRRHTDINTSKTPCPQIRLGCSFLCRSWGARHKRACPVIQDRREATGWSYTSPVAEWQAAVICTLAEFHVNGAAREAGAAAEVAASRKEKKYADLDSRYLFKPIAVKTPGVLNSSANSLLKDRKLATRSLSTLGSLGRSFSYTSAFQCSCNVSMPFR